MPRRSLRTSATPRVVNSRPPLPPFTEESARQKVQAAEDAWNSCDPDRVALGYTEDSQWRNRAEFFEGRDAIREFLRNKWEREQEYRLKKELWSFGGVGRRSCVSAELECSTRRASTSNAMTVSAGTTYASHDRLADTCSACPTPPAIAPAVP